MRHLLMTTALVAMTAAPVYAEKHSGSEMKVDAEAQTMEGMSISADNLMGRTVYTPSNAEESNAGWEDVTDVPETWTDVADVSDILLDQDGNLKSVVLDAGGFLGMGETEKSIDISNLKFVADQDDEGEYFVVYTGSKQMLEESEDYDQARMEEEGYRSAAMDSERQMSDEERTAQARNDEQQPVGRLDRSTSQPASLANMMISDLSGANVYGPNDEHVGEIGEMVLAEDGKIDTVVVDVGGFLGLGEKEVALKFDQLELLSSENGALMIHVPMTEEELEGMQEWETDL